MKKNIIKNKKNTGFTLIETILYVVIFSLLISSIMIFSNMITNSKNHNQMILEIKNQGSNLIEIIKQKIHGAQGINLPNISENGDVLSLSILNSNTNPTIFSVNDGVLYITEGAEDPIALTNNKIVVNNLIFSNLARPETPGIIQIRFTLNSNISGKNYSANFYGSASIR